ncbi:MAG TPA: carboxypeptidase-like regulatory domain-containing protein [Terriglobia bacterium]|nr:carboxypeptidase-like regulatory domain-containing protein [Terriglobia bacterium]
MTRFAALAALLLSLTLAAPTFAQSTYATVSGTVEDTSHALLPGVSVTATNNATGVVTTVVSNESGAYNLTSLLPGTYTVKAELPGFQTTTFTNVQLGNAAQVRLNFALQVAAQAQSVEVTVAADTLLATSSSSIGEVLSQQKVQDLPIVGNNALSFFTMMPGVRMNDDGVTGTFAGIATSNINVQRDGIDASASARYVQAGAQTATFVNPDLVGEIRIITAPVDAEMGRGNGQVQFLTRSGTNDFHGTGTWFARNTALDANTWTNNRQVNSISGRWQPVTPNWTNTHQLTGSIGGPIQKNKTFFFALFDDVIVRARTTQNPVVLTPCARNGIFRYFDGWNNGSDVTPTTLGTTPTTAVVDGAGNPVTPASNPTGGPFTGALRYASVFGKLPAALPSANADCSNIAALVQSGTNWDPFRKALDPTGYVTKVLGKIPSPNNYDVGDGLNFAGYRWLRNENNGTENIFGYAGNLARQQINTKIDHNFNTKNKVGVSYTYEDSHGNANYSTLPGGYQGRVFRHPQTLSASFTSTLTPSLVNEARIGMRRTGSNTYNALNDPSTGKAAQGFLPNYNGYPVMLALAIFGPPPTNSTIVNGAGFLGGNSTSSYLDTTALWTYGDSLSWTKGKHAFKVGGEIRRGNSLGYDAGISPTTIPRATSGDAPSAAISTTAISTTNMPGLAGTAVSGNNQAMRQLLDFLAGSVASVTQLRFMQDPNKLSGFEDYKTFPWRVRDFHNNEASFYFKDDWKLHKSLTLNLGLRWDFFGVPYESHGLMAAAQGGPSAIWGISGSGFTDWMKPGVRGTSTVSTYVGKGSPNSGTPWYENDYNNFGPAIGFAWQPRWFGEGKTTVRGGYQVTYQIGQSGNNIFQEQAVPGSTDSITYTGDSNTPYLDLTKVPSAIPAPSTVIPMQPVSTLSRSQQVYNPEKNITTPYTQNLTLSVTRSLRSNLTVDVRYLGTLARKQWNPVFNINIPDFLYNGLKDAFDAARSGGESVLLNQIFNGINLGNGVVGQNGLTGAQQLRLDSRFNTNLANGNYSALASTLNTINYTTALNPNLPAFGAGVQGMVLRANNFPDNFIVANPQYGTLNLITQDYSTNYHSLETQITLRPTQGLALQSTYTFSKNMGTGGPFGLGPTFTNPINRHADYSVQTDTRTQDWRTNGTFTLPVGPGKLLFSGSKGTVARVIEGWQTGFVMNFNSGAPLTVTANQTLYGNGRPDLVGAFPTKGGHVTFNGTPSAFGSYWKPNSFKVAKDPQCLAIASNIQALCTLNAIADAGTGNVLLQNAAPGAVPTMGLGSIIGPGRWRFDANVSKMIRIKESKTLQFRLDATDVLNHAEPNAPSLNLTGATATQFGLIGGKSDLHRQLQAQLRFNF